MNELLLATIVIGVVILGSVGLGCWAWIRVSDGESERLTDELALLRARADSKLVGMGPPTPAEDAPRVSDMAPPGWPTYEHAKAEVSAPPKSMSASPMGAPLPLDPDKPPKRMVYRPKAGSIAPAPSCACHLRPLSPDQPFVLWPIKNGDDQYIDVVICMDGAS